MYRKIETFTNRKNYFLRTKPTIKSPIVIKNYGYSSFYVA